MSILSVAFNEAFSFFNEELKNENLTDIANIFYNLIQSKIQQFRASCEKNNDKSKYENFKNKIDEYFFFKEYNSTKHYDKLSSDELEKIINDLKIKKRGHNVEDSKIKELEFLLNKKRQKDRTIGILKNILKNVEKIRNFFSHTHHKEIKIELSNESLEFLQLLYKIACEACCYQGKGLFGNKDRFSLEEILFMFSLFSHKYTLNEAISQLGFKRFLNCHKDKQKYCRDCKEINNCQKNIGIVKNVYSYFSISSKFKKNNGNNDYFNRFISILDFFRRQNYNFMSMVDDEGNKLEPLTDIDETFNISRNNIEVMNILCDFIGDFFKKNQNCNLRFSTKYDKYELYGIETYQYDRYDIYNNNINIINPNGDGWEYCRIGINELKKLSMEILEDIQNEKQEADILTDIIRKINNNLNINRIKNIQEKQNNKRQKCNLENKLNSRKKYIIAKLEKEIAEINESNDKINYKQIQHIINFFQTFIFEKKVDNKEIFDSFRENLINYSKESFSKFKNSKLPKTLEAIDLSDGRVEIKCGKLHNSDDLKEFYKNILEKEIEIIDKIGINDSNFLKKIGIKENNNQYNYEDQKSGWINTFCTKTKDKEKSFSKIIHSFEKDLNILPLIKGGIFQKYENNEIIKQEYKEDLSKYKLERHKKEIYRLDILILGILKYYINNLKDNFNINLDEYDDKNKKINISINDIKIELNDLLKDYIYSNLEAIMQANNFYSDEEKERIIEDNTNSGKCITEKEKIGIDISKKLIILKHFRNDCVKKYINQIFGIESYFIGKLKIEYNKDGYISFDEILRKINEEHSALSQDLDKIKLLRNIIMHNAKHKKQNKPLEYGKTEKSLKHGEIEEVLEKIKQVISKNA